MSTVLITGGSSGIGEELAKLFAKKKYNLILLAKTLEKLEKTQSEIINKYSIDCKIIQYDLNDIDGIDELFEKYNFKDVDIIVNCAGIGNISLFKDLTLEEELEIMNVNSFSSIILAKLFIKNFYEKLDEKIVEKFTEIEKNKDKKDYDEFKKSQPEKAVINICSTASLFVHPYMAIYSASKSLILYYSLALSEEVKNENKKRNISKNRMRIFTICPGPTATGFLNEKTKEKFSIYEKYEMKPEIVAEEIMKAFYLKKGFHIVGLRNRITVKMLKLLPFSLQLKIVGKFLRKGIL